MSYQVKNIPDEILEAIDRDYKELGGRKLIGGRPVVITDAAIESVNVKTEASNKERLHCFDPAVALARGIVDVRGRIEFRLVGYLGEG